MLDACGVLVVPLPPGGTYVVELTFGGVGGAVVLPDGATGVAVDDVPESCESFTFN